MATVVLSVVGGIAGGLLGGPAGALVGRALGGLAGAALDNAIIGALTPTQHYRVQGPRLKELQVQASTEGAPIPRIYGRVRLAGQIIWATRLEEEVRTETTTVSSGGGKGGGGGGKVKTTTTTYHYYANLAIAVCEGPVARIERIWADGKPLDPEADGIVMRVYPGDEMQDPDPLIAAKEGISNTPAYRGVAYVVFERLALERFGNRIPQFAFEVVRPLDDVAGRVRAVNIIPGAGEFFCDPKVITRDDGPGQGASENAHASEKTSDWSVSLDQLQAVAPNVEAAALVVSWFGDDLRCGQCTIRPKVEVKTKRTRPESWRVAGLSRAQAKTVSTLNGRPAFGGTPSDAAVIRAIRDLKRRGLKPVLYPFVMMDIPPENGLPDPYGGVEQPPYPWRGRITCDAAPGFAGSPDGTAAVNAQIGDFLGTSRPEHFHLNGDKVVYTGPDEWRYRRFILHYAYLAKAAGGVEAFLIGSELRGLTWLRNGPGSYPFVQALKQLAADVKAILGPDVKVSYAADWSEWFGHHPDDGSGDVYFHLDPLWADANIDFIGIDNYMPLADWRSGMAHRDAEAGAKSIYDPDYLKANIAGGEYYDWFYASAVDRAAQRRTPITDDAYGKPWVFRCKDILNWWKNLHYDRPGGVEKATPTPWRPQSKPIWFTEAGCPALDKGANQPNVFFDPKSSESALPHFSSGRRDDAMQKAYLRALMDYWAAPGAHNPVSSAYGGRMVEASRIFFWAWDARPYPWFPALSAVWGDHASYAVGHWLNGRLDGISVESLIAAILDDWGFPADKRILEATGAQVTGYVLDRPMSARAAIEPLLSAFALDAVESAGRLAIVRQQRRAAAHIGLDDLADTDPERPLFEVTRAEPVEIPQAATLHYLEEAADHRPAAVHARITAEGDIARAEAEGGRAPSVSQTLPAAMPQSLAGAQASVLLRRARSGKEHLSFALGPKHLHLEAGDVITFAPAGARTWRITRIVEDGPLRRIEAVRHDPLAFEPQPWPERRATTTARRPLPAPLVLVLDLPRLRDRHDPERPYAAAFSRPWPGTVALERDGAFVATAIDAPAIIGELLDPLPAASPWLYQRGIAARVRLYDGTLASVTEEALLAGANAAAIGDPATGRWEIVQFATAELMAPGVWRLSRFLRGQSGSEPEIAAHAPGSRFVLLNGRLVQAEGFGIAQAGQTLSCRAGPARRDPGDPAWVRFDVPFAARGLRPLAPVHLRRQVNTAGDWTFTWIRRSRVPEAADAWGAGDAPLAETAERYVFQIADAAAPEALVRSVEVTSPRHVWSAAEQAADFPSGLPAQIRVRVAQISEVTGPGAWAEKMFTT
ncbi:glycoside hydrolase/phage tail family protein [Thermopetrobacter sp. TC1]|uniref:baseplate multidomain protein megatron n=1 Tax=Thermopetrobacter sp. TC1 TaxID=1495045 RepID=UPI000570A30B|nr:glycoside hydrolase/phage tail family protein [Thermopetrobacter sp. TC1]